MLVDTGSKRVQIYRTNSLIEIRGYPIGVTFDIQVLRIVNVYNQAYTLFNNSLFDRNLVDSRFV